MVNTVGTTDDGACVGSRHSSALASLTGVNDSATATASVVVSNFTMSPCSRDTRRLPVALATCYFVFSSSASCQP